MAPVLPIPHPHLLLLDKFEQIITAAPHLSALLSACPHLKLFITSRARLRLRGEHLFDLRPLTPPPPDHDCCQSTTLSTQPCADDYSP